MRHKPSPRGKVGLFTPQKSGTMLVLENNLSNGIVSKAAPLLSSYFDDSDDRDSEQKPVDEVHLAKFQRPKRSLTLLGVLFVIFLTSAGVHAYLQERHFIVLGLADKASWFVAALLYVFQCTYGVIQIASTHQVIYRKITVPAPKLAILGVIAMTASGFSALSLKYVNYPTNVIFKSCKLIPVMIGSIFLLKIRYGPLDVIGSLMMCIGVAAFVLAGKDSTPQFSFIGVFALFISISADGLLGNFQKKIFGSHPHATPEELTVGTTLFGAGITFGLLIINNRFISSIVEVQSRGTLTWLTIAGQGFAGYVNTLVVMMMVQEFDPLTAATLATMKRVVAISSSFFFFSKPFSFQYLWSGVLVAFGLYVNVFAKQRRDGITKARLAATKEASPA